LACTFGAERVEIAEVLAGTDMIGGGDFGKAVLLESVEGAKEAEGGEIVAGVGEFVGAIAKEFEDFIGAFIAAMNTIGTAPGIEQGIEV
jgi:hypothetical protein